MEIGTHVILTHPEKECHKGKEAVIVKKQITDENVAIYRVQIVGHKQPLPRWATDSDLEQKIKYPPCSETVPWRKR